jgi:hypothetical protein
MLQFAAIAVVVAGAAALILSTRWFWRTLGSSTITDAQKVVLAAMGTAAVSLTGLSITRAIDRSKIVLQEQRARKTPTYEEFMSLIFKTIQFSKKGANAPTEDELVSLTYSMMQKVTIWGSDELVAEYARFRGLTLTSSPPARIMSSVARQILAIRRDLGHANKNLDETKILSIFVNDIATGSTTEEGVSADQYEPFLRTYGPPSSIDSTESDKERPLIPLRSLIYDDAQVKVFFFPNAMIGEPPPYAAWTFFGAIDTKTGNGLPPDDLKDRLSRRTNASSSQSA